MQIKHWFGFMAIMRCRCSDVLVVVGVRACVAAVEDMTSSSLAIFSASCFFDVSKGQFIVT